MLSGFITPESIGIHDKNICYKLIINSSKLIKFSNIFINIFNILFFIGSFALCYQYLSDYILVFSAIISIISLTISSNYLFNIIFGEFVYYFIITYYLRLKFENLLKRLKILIQTNHRMNSHYIKAIINEFNKIYSDINEYNSNYWSIYLLIIWINFGVLITFSTYDLLFDKENVILFKLLSILVVFIYSSIFLMIINISSAIYIDSNNSYKLFNSLFCSLKYNCLTKFKVSLIININFGKYIIVIQ